MIRGINHITLTVKDIDESISFYQDVLGFSAKAKWAKGAYLEAGEAWLCLVKGQATPTSDYTHIAFSASEASISALEEKKNELNIDEWQSNSSEGKSIYIRDPDGHKLELHFGSLSSRLKSLESSPYEGLVWL